MNPFESIEQARAALARETRVDLRFAPIEVDVAHASLVLHGEVDGIEAKRVAVDAVRAVPGLPRVVDHLRVRPAVPQGDGAVRDEVYTRLTQDPAYRQVSISARMEGGAHLLARAASRRQGTIDVTVAGGVVTLRGRVPDPVARQLAGVLAWKNSGTRDVVNELDVGGASLPADALIRQVIQRLCERQVLLRGHTLEASVEDGVVTLRGRVPTPTAAQLLRHDVWYIEGVREVIDDIEVG